MSPPESAAGYAETTRVLIVEDQGMFRSFLEDWVPAQDGFTLVGAFATAEEALRNIETLSPHVRRIRIERTDPPA